MMHHVRTCPVCLSLCSNTCWCRCWLRSYPFAGACPSGCRFGTVRVRVRVMHFRRSEAELKMPRKIFLHLIKISQASENFILLPSKNFKCHITTNNAFTYDSQPQQTVHHKCALFVAPHKHQLAAASPPLDPGAATWHAR